MRRFDFYEFTAIVVPGAILLFAAGLIWPERMESILRQDLSLGSFSLVLLFMYVAGHLIQAFGNILERAWWKVRGGWPSDRPRSGKGYLLTKEQVVRLQEIVRNEFGYTDIVIGPDLCKWKWYAIFRQIYAVVRAAGRDDRAHFFLGTYNMFRGILASSLFAAFVAYLARGCNAWPLFLFFCVVAGLALFRMNLFAVHYARETFIQFLSLPSHRKGGAVS